MFSSKLKISKFLDYCTFYSSTGTNVANFFKHADICFLRVFHRGNNEIFKNVYTIKVLKCGKPKDPITKSNFCLLSKKDIELFLKDAASYGYHTKPIIKFSEHEKYYKIIMEVDDTAFAHRFLLSYVRYLYEAPYNIMLYETLKVKKECELFKDVSIFNLFHLILMSNDIIKRFNLGCHSINCGNVIKFYDYDYIIKAFKDKKNDCFECAFPKCYAKFNRYIIDNNEDDYLKYYALKKYRKDRIKIYINNYKLINK